MVVAQCTLVRISACILQPIGGYLVSDLNVYHRYFRNKSVTPQVGSQHNVGKLVLCRTVPGRSRSSNIGPLKHRLVFHLDPHRRSSYATGSTRKASEKKPSIQGRLDKREEHLLQ